MEVTKIEVPSELVDDVQKYVERLKRKKRILQKTFGILKGEEKSATELKVEIYEELYG